MSQRLVLWELQWRRCWGSNPGQCLQLLLDLRRRPDDLPPQAPISQPKLHSVPVASPDTPARVQDDLHRRSDDLPTRVPSHQPILGSVPVTALDPPATIQDNLHRLSDDLSTHVDCHQPTSQSLPLTTLESPATVQDDVHPSPDDLHTTDKVRCDHYNKLCKNRRALVRHMNDSHGRNKRKRTTDGLAVGVEKFLCQRIVCGRLTFRSQEELVKHRITAHNMTDEDANSHSWRKKVYRCAKQPCTRKDI